MNDSTSIIWTAFKWLPVENLPFYSQQMFTNIRTEKAECWIFYFFQHRGSFSVFFIKNVVYIQLQVNYSTWANYHLLINLETEMWTHKLFFWRKTNVERQLQQNKKYPISEERMYKIQSKWNLNRRCIEYIFRNYKVINKGVLFCMSEIKYFGNF